MDLDDEGMGVLADLHGDGDPEDERAREEFREIKDSVFQERTMGDRSYKAMWKRYRGRVLLAVSAQAFAQLVSLFEKTRTTPNISLSSCAVFETLQNGINVISYYAPLVFESAGWIGRDAIFMTGINGISTISLFILLLSEILNSLIPFLRIYSLRPLNYPNLVPSRHARSSSDSSLRSNRTFLSFLPIPHPPSFLSFND